MIKGEERKLEIAPPSLNCPLAELFRKEQLARKIEPKFRIAPPLPSEEFSWKKQVVISSEEELRIAPPPWVVKLFKKEQLVRDSEEPLELLIAPPLNSAELLWKVQLLRESELLLLKRPAPLRFVLSVELALALPAVIVKPSRMGVLFTLIPVRTWRAFSELLPPELSF